MVSLRRVLPYLVVYFKHVVDVALKMHCYAPFSLHCYAHSACIAMYPFSCIIMHTPPALLCTFQLHCHAPFHLHCYALFPCIVMHRPVDAPVGLMLQHGYDIVVADLNLNQRVKIWHNVLRTRLLKK